MKVLIINDLLIHGGAEMQGLREKEILESYGHEVFFLTFDNNFPSDSKVYCEKNGFYNIKINNLRVEKIKNKLFFNKKLFNEINETINFIKPDIVHVNNLYLAPITQYKSLNNWNAIQTIRDYSAICPIDTCIKSNGKVCLGSKYNNCYLECGKDLNKVFKIFRSNKYNKKRFKSIRKFICPSEKLTSYCLDHGYDIKCINNPFDFKKFHTFNKEVDFENKAYLYYGNINRDKGILELMKAFISFCNNKDDVRLIIAGKIDDEIKEEFELLVKNKKISYLGYLKYEDMIDMLKRVYAIVVPSVWMENYPNTVLEGMATKTLVIGSNRGGIPSMLSNNKGLIFDVSKKNEIIDKLEESYYLSQDEYNKIVQSSYEYTLNNNSTQQYYLRIIKAFEELL